jgi:hypothetical protein
MSKTSLLNGSRICNRTSPRSCGCDRDDCKSGYVWRDAKDGDGVCVSPAERAEAIAQNANAENNRKGAAASTAQTPAVTDTFGGRHLQATSFA